MGWRRFRNFAINSKFDIHIKPNVLYTHVGYIFNKNPFRFANGKTTFPFLSNMKLGRSKFGILEYYKKATE